MGGRGRGEGRDEGRDEDRERGGRRLLAVQLSTEFGLLKSPARVQQSHMLYFEQQLEHGPWNRVHEMKTTYL